MAGATHRASRCAAPCCTDCRPVIRLGKGRGGVKGFVLWGCAQPAADVSRDGAPAAGGPGLAAGAHPGGAVPMRWRRHVGKAASPSAAGTVRSCAPRHVVRPESSPTRAGGGRGRCRHRGAAAGRRTGLAGALGRRRGAAAAAATALAAAALAAATPRPTPPFTIVAGGGGRGCPGRGCPGSGPRPCTARRI